MHEARAGRRQRQAGSAWGAVSTVSAAVRSPSARRGAGHAVRVRSAQQIGLAGWVALAACGGTDATSDESTPPGRFERVICPECVRAGGETSDFGDGGEFVPLGAGIQPAPSPCEQSETVSSIELEAARALGFDELLDRLEGEFDLPFAWSPTEFDLDRPARGYAANTRVRGTLRALSAKHHVPSLEGCVDSLRVEVETTLETGDGALSIGGTLEATIERGTQRPTIEGYLDLSQARGTLELDQPPSTEEVFGYVRAFLYAWPDGMRLSLYVGAADARDIGGDTFSYFYEPLEAWAPTDGCRASDRPLAFDEPTPSTGDGRSLAARFPELLSRVTAPQPFTASWMSGGETALEIAVGEPLILCDEAVALSGRVPYRVQSSDGRIDIDSEARMRVSFEANGALGASFFEIFQPGGVHGAASFAESTGIFGVDFGAFGGGTWHTELLFDPAAASPLSGQVTVEGVDVDGRSTGLPGAVGGVLDSLAW